MKTACASAFALLLLLLAGPSQARWADRKFGGGLAEVAAAQTPGASASSLSASSTAPSSTPSAPSQTPSGQSTTTTPAPSTTTTTGADSSSSSGSGAGAGSAPDAGPGGMVIEIINSWTAPISVSFGNNAGGPTPIGNPSATALPSSTSYAFPTGWAGRIYVGPGPSIDAAGSKIEGSVTGPPDIDVSYVDGYSVPIVCSSAGTPVSGCNIDLFAQSGITCANKFPGPVCHNPAQGIADGPAPAFFAACAGAAYTYPNDNDANMGGLSSGTVTCCIGTACTAPDRQGKNEGQGGAASKAKRAPAPAPSEKEHGRAPMSPSLLAGSKGKNQKHVHGHAKRGHHKQSS